MTLWNPLNVFSAQQRQPGDDSMSASFDPDRTGDPQGGSPSMPAIGFGDTHVGSGGSQDPRRQAIGFAPPQAEPHFRTELSFKRHYESPRASVASGEDGEDGASEWQTPVTEPLGAEGATDEVHSTDPPEAEAREAEAHEAEAHEADPPAEEHVPFYKRELGFKRKRAASEDTVEAQEHEAADDLIDQVDDLPEKTDEDRAVPEVIVASVAEEATLLDVSADESVPTIPADGEAAASVPFYKRELSFRRKAVAPEEESIALFADEIETPDDPLQDESHETAAIADITEPGPVEGHVESHAQPATSYDEHDAPVELIAAGEVEDNDDAVAPVDEVDAESEKPADEIASEDLVLAAAAIESTQSDVSEFDATASDAFALDEVPAIDDAAPQADDTTSRWNKRPARKSAKRQPNRGAKGNKVVGLKIGASQIAAAVITETDEGHELVQLARRPLEAGIVVDGEVRDQDALANALKSFFDDEQLPKKGVRIGLASNRIGVRTFDIVGIDDEERFDNAVRFKAHEVLPVAVHEAVLDYRVLEQRPNEAGEQMRRVLLVVAPQDQVAPYQSVADRVGLKLSGIDLEALGLLRAFVEPKPFAARLADDTATVVVAIGHESSTLLVAGGGACEFTRVFDWGGGALQTAIAESLEVMPAEATTILRHLSLSGPGRKYDGLDDVTRAKATEAVRLGLTPFARELVNSLQFYQTQADSLGIGEIVITGGTSHLEGLDQALHAMIGVAASVGDPLARVSVVGAIDPAIEAAIGSMAVPIGLAINDDRARGVNLLRETSAKPRSRRSSLIGIGVPVAAAVPLVALGFLYFGAHGKVSDQQAQLDAVQAEIAALPQPQTATIDAAVVGDEAVRATAVASVLGGRLAWDAVLRDLSRVLPANVWLTKLSVTQPAAGNLADVAGAQAAAAIQGQTTTPTAVSIDGFTYSQPDVARLLARLGTLATLRNVTLGSSETQLLGTRDVTHFVIVADLNQTGGPS